MTTRQALQASPSKPIPMRMVVEEDYFPLLFPSKMLKQDQFMDRLMLMTALSKTAEQEEMPPLFRRTRICRDLITAWHLMQAL